jgi:molecular chaperone GrpE (heat shock protein)
MWRWLRRALASEGAPPELGELLEASRKSARAQAKLALKVEELERKVEAGLADLRSRIEAKGANGHDDLFDALDLLDQAALAVNEGRLDGVTDGLLGIGARLERAMGRAQLARVAPVGVKPDGARFRVVGTEEDASLPEGAVVRVVRAAIVSGDKVVREGEVTVNRRSS